MTVAKDQVVYINYHLKNDAGQTLDSSAPGEPLAYVHGHGNIIPGLEKELEGKSSGEKISVSIAPEEAYGEKQIELIQQVPLTEFPSDMELKVSDQFQVQLPDGIRIATVTALNESHATVDMNHPLAGETLHFDVEIGEIRPASTEEIEHGHVHGPGGHQH